MRIVIEDKFCQYSLRTGPSTYMLDGHQYIIVGSGDALYALRLAGK
jgi:hypothetical protein